jgi:hypothetical protein
VLVVTQTGHVFEHVAQMVQIHVLGLTGGSARGVFGALDIEWVHFIFNTWVIVLIPSCSGSSRETPGCGWRQFFQDGMRSSTL